MRDELALMKQQFNERDKTIQKLQLENQQMKEQWTIEKKKTSNS